MRCMVSSAERRAPQPRGHAGAGGLRPRARAAGRGVRSRVGAGLGAEGTLRHTGSKRRRGPSQRARPLRHGQGLGRIPVSRWHKVGHLDAHHLGGGDDLVEAQHDAADLVPAHHVHPLCPGDRPTRPGGSQPLHAPHGSALRVGPSPRMSEQACFYSSSASAALCVFRNFATCFRCSGLPLATVRHTSLSRSTIALTAASGRSLKTPSAHL